MKYGCEIEFRWLSMLKSVYAKKLTTKCSCFQGKESLAPENENCAFFHLTCVPVVWFLVFYFMA